MGILIHVQDRIINLPSSPIDWQGLNEYEQSSIQFCQDWMNGMSGFETSTSGSTGKPKTIYISKAQALASIHNTAEALQLQAGDHSLVCLDTRLIAGKMMLLRSLELGINITLIPPSSNPLETLSSTHFDFTALVPYQLSHLLQEEKHIQQLNRMKAIIIGGASINYELEEQINKLLSVPVYSTYGMTETVSHIALRRLNGELKRSYYQAFNDVELSQDEDGCLSIKAPVTNNEWIQTNDIVDLIGAKKFKVLGRKDNVVNSGGIKIYVETIEEIIQKTFHEQGIKYRFFTIGIPHKRLGHELYLIIESPKWEKSLSTELINTLKKQCPEYKSPKGILFTAQFAETASQKINRMETLALILANA